MKTKIRKQQLASYSALAISVMAITSAEGQIIYTDIDPDSVIDYTGDSMLFDFNDDGIDDLELTAIYGPYVFVSTYFTSTYSVNQLIVTPQTGCEFAANIWGDPVLFQAESLIDSAWDFFTDTEIVLGISDYQPVFLGFRFQIGAETHYGWLRMHDTEGGLELMDYAYEASDNIPIAAHAPNTPYTVSNIVVTDAGDTHDPSDIHVSFEIPDDESSIGAYRIFVEPYSYLNYMLETINTADANYYTEVFPDGTDKTVTIDTAQLDLWDDPVEEFDILYVYVESVSNLQPEESVVKKYADNFIYGVKLDTAEVVSVIQKPGDDPRYCMSVKFRSPDTLYGIINYFVTVTPYSELPVTDSLFYFTNAYRNVLNDWEVFGGVWVSNTIYTIDTSPEDVFGNDLEFGVPYGACIQSHSLWAEYSDYRYETLSCSGPFTLIEPAETVIEDIAGNNFIAIAGQSIVVQAPGDLVLPAQLNLYNIEGQKIYTQSINQKYESIQIELPAGIYIAELSDNKTKLLQKLFLNNTSGK